MTSSIPPPIFGYRRLEEFTLADLEAIRLLLRGGSTIDWYRLNFQADAEAASFLRAQDLDLDDAADLARAESVKNAAIGYLKRNFDFPIPKPVANLNVRGLLMLASSKGHRQLCACTILKVMHIIHHLEARELLFMLPTSAEEVFHLVEQKVYRVIGEALASGFPIQEFIGGRKNRDSLYTKLLSKSEATAARIYDKVRFRIVMRSPEDIFPMLDYLMKRVFPFNFVIPGESSNSLLHFKSFCQAHPRLDGLTAGLQLPPGPEDEEPGVLDNVFTAPDYRVVHFVVDMPIRLPKELLAAAPPAAWALGRVIFVQTEFQVIDKQTDEDNELGQASHSAYKDRQRQAVMRRLKVGKDPNRAPAKPRKMRRRKATKKKKS